VFRENEGDVLAGIEKSFKPHPNMVKLFDYYLLMAIVPEIAFGLIVTSAVYIFQPQYTYIPAISIFVPVAVVTGFVFYWIRKYYRSINYQLTRDEVVVEHGVWWKMKHTVPYARVMSVDIIQGPLSRSLGIATVDIYTAGYTGVAGGTGGPGSRRAEASIMHVSDFTVTRENILQIVRGKPLFGTTTSDTGAEMLSELRKMRELLEKSSEK
jgi:membrane protein YdbS with pleckstrin-like domain